MLYSNMKIFALLLALMLFCPRESFADGQTPWRNSNIYGSVKDYSPDLRDDFYMNVNNDWIINARLKPGRAGNGSFYELQDEIDASLKALMHNKSLTGHDAELVQNLYSLWVDWDKRNKSGLGDLPELAKKIMNIKTLDELNKYFMSESSFNHGSFIAKFVIGLDNIDSESYNIELAPTGLSLRDSAEYKNMTSNGARVKKFSDSVASYMLKRLGLSDSEIERVLNLAFEFEGKIASHMMTINELESPEAIEKTYNPLSMQELRDKSQVFPYADILEAHKVNSKLMNLQEPEWLKALNELYNESNLESIKAYLLIDLAKSYITVIDEPAYREYQRLFNERYGITGTKSDEELATDYVHDNLAVPVSRLYIARHVSENTKREVKQIIQDTIKFYREMLKSEDWLSEETRSKAIEKLDAMRLNAAYPDKWHDYSGLEINASGSLLDAVEAIRNFNKRKFFYERINSQVDHDLWISDVVVVNAYYKPMENSINIIAGILSGDFYNPSMSYEEKLGGVGTVIGHEISHAFDTRGALFDKNGSMSSWWTEEDYKKFQARADRLIKYFSAMKVDNSGKNYNGALVQTESIADMAGVKSMLGIAANHEGFDYNKFFRSYARIWKVIYTPERVDFLVNVDVHALPYLRVNAILQQYEEFMKTYDIKPDNKMYLAPDERVAVW
ncbi:MAG: M13 family metallopeptidase [Synergistaceae bacterium]|nr:M13 family metallopeptidase [Synergistaceae bacterium]